jgi:phage tail tape-measure protein
MKEQLAKKKVKPGQIVGGATGAVAGVAAGAIIGSILLPIPILGFTLGGYIGATAMGLLGGTTGVKIAETVEKAIEEKKKVKLDVVHTEGNHAPTEEVVSFQ